MKTKFRFLFFLVPVAMIAVGSLALMGLWNWLMPSLFGMGTLTIIQALGILILVRILTWGGGWFGWGRWRRYAYAGSGGYYHCHPHGHGHEFWRMKMKEKWENMSPEEKEKWKARYGGDFWNEAPAKEEPQKV